MIFAIFPLRKLALNQINSTDNLARLSLPVTAIFIDEISKVKVFKVFRKTDVNDLSLSGIMQVLFCHCDKNVA
ncbi:hypothetical protein VF14_34140 [Nostoc linckia z18]|uniref:Uncharacterized protein n=2 Tax=Nostoc linckia TaxID=92942 RepID=A0A9Q5Z613_NOSLI|nr:hypothetical protein VF02_34835 [Nostoc linckia z1]PHJ57520.1 hypothetical protein VF05_35640 [Nostoc linckia z3]PHJ58911.1 hypothetical protein VF03_35150 [Nostoc linckia z2]PHJ74217.1 hypothetical protein VF06_35095 [Nostoc linckia z4]PHJ81101.1 hypothetical protein VF07_30750 [Nostoc linckia z6]PHJ89737.1 hypothetical protein VF04_31920 [Nostoc linckia z7]PHJ95294.1 hypothetical protein VF08_32355 [Nostoc linckia z8]PHK03525.1 hypothetical protein VF09_29845 [Nostoc linckia z9]PHK1847